MIPIFSQIIDQFGVTIEKRAEQLFGTIIKIDPFHFEQIETPQPDITTEANQILFFREFGYTCINELFQSQFSIDTYVGKGLLRTYIIRAELLSIRANGDPFYEISKSFSNRFCKTWKTISNTSYIYGIGYLITFENSII